MSAKHTPGPWIAEIPAGNSRYFITPQGAGKWDEIAEVFNPPGTRTESEARAVANARLIAAAPELLGVAQAVALRGHADGCASVSSRDYYKCDCLVGLAQAAIAKAVPR